MLSFEHAGKFILSDLTVHIPKGVAVGIIGASGAGKTTLLRLACGLLKPEQGEVYTLQKNPVEYRAWLGSRIGCLLERMPVLEAERSVADNFRELQIIHRMSKKAFLEEYVPLAEQFGIREYEQETVKSLSFGQRRRAELAAVLLHRPELLLLDEPTNGLDENAKTVLREVLQERMERGMTVVLTSHDMREVSEVCQRILLLEQGKMIYYGEKAPLLRRYAPMDVMKLSFTGTLPDMEDLPVEKYEVCGEELRLTYNSNYITASELLDVILRQTSVREVTIQKPSLEQVIFEIKAAGIKKTEEEGIES